MIVWNQQCSSGMLCSTENLWRVQDSFELGPEILSEAIFGFLGVSECVNENLERESFCQCKAESALSPNRRVDWDILRPELSLIRSVCPERKIPARCVQ